jgi:hypothetical protein
MGVSVSAKLAVWPASIEAWEGEAASVKSAKRTVRVNVAVVVSDAVVSVVAVGVGALEELTVPVTVKLSEVEVTSVRLPTVSVLDSPGAIVPG